MMKAAVFVAVCLAFCVYGDHHGDHTRATGDNTGEALSLSHFSQDSQELLNELIHYQIESVFHYMAMATWFRRHDVDVIGMSLMYNSWARKKMTMSKMAMMYMVKRGAPINFMDVKKPSATSWSTPVDALVLTLRREKTLTEKINQLARHSIKEHHDPNLFAFLMNNVVDAQSEHVFEAAAYIHKMEKGGPKFGLMAMNRQMVTKYRNFLDCESDAEKYKWNY